MPSTGSSPGARWEDRLREGTEFLIALAADRHEHGHRRSLLSHLIGTAHILSAWSQPEHICLAGLMHSVYGN